jgi:hypothetical protein
MAEVDELPNGRLRVGLTAAQEVTDVLAAESKLLQALIDTTTTEIGGAGPAYVKKWLENYWLKTLNDHKIVTDEWKDGVDGSGKDPTLAAARAELDAVRGLRSAARLYREAFAAGNGATRAAFRSWLNDFEVEIGAKRDIIEALEKP